MLKEINILVTTDIKVKVLTAALLLKHLPDRIKRV